MSHFDAFLPVAAGQRTLSLLPPWHIYERACGYYILSRGAAMVYTSIKKFRDDLGVYRPDHLVCVPLVLDTLRSRVLAALKAASAVRRALAATLLAVAIAYTRARRVVDGLDVRFARAPPSAWQLFKAWAAVVLLAPLHWVAQRLVGAKVRAALGVQGCVVSGGGSLAPHLDDFFEAVQLEVINGWGLTESSPVLACRAATTPGRLAGNVRGTVGRAIPGTEFRVVDPADLSVELPDGQQGLILARGPGVTPGYFRNPGATAAAFPVGGGWLDTGDVGWRAPTGVPGSRMAGCVVLSGRAKDTIVLSSGENVEPQPIEDAICSSPLVKFVVLVGQGRRSLGALLVPDEDALAEAAQVWGVDKLSKAEVQQAMREAVAAGCAGRVRWEQVAAFAVLASPFSVEDGTLTRTMKPRRAAIMQKYAQEVAKLEAKLR